MSHTEDSPLLMNGEDGYMNPGEVYLFSPSANCSELKLTALNGTQRGLHILRRRTVIVVLKSDKHMRFLQGNGRTGWIATPSIPMRPSFQRLLIIYRHQLEISHSYVCCGGRLLLGRDVPYLLLTAGSMLLFGVLYVYIIDWQFRDHRWVYMVRV